MNADVVHSTFTLERDYPAGPAAVFAAWSDEKVKAQWFAPGVEHELDFRAGGRETVRAQMKSGTRIHVESRYEDIVPERRIVLTTAMHADDVLATLSITTVEFAPGEGGGTHLTLTEQDTMLDGHEKPEWRNQGTGDQLDRLGEHLRGASVGAA